MTKLTKHVKLAQPESFEAALTELERIVVEMETDKPDRLGSSGQGSVWKCVESS